MADAYHTIEQIQALLNTQQILISEDSQPDETTITGWIAETDARIEAALKDRYVLPPIGTKALALLAEIGAKLTGARVWNALFAGNIEPGQRTYADVLERQARDILNALAAGDIEFPDEDPLVDPSVGPGRPAATQGIEREPIFSIEDIF